MLEQLCVYNIFLPHFYPLLEGFFWDNPQRRRYDSLDGFHALKTGLLDDLLGLGEKKKSHKNQMIRKVVPVWRWSFQPGTAECSGPCEQVQ